MAGGLACGLASLANLVCILCFCSQKKHNCKTAGSCIKQKSKVVAFDDVCVGGDVGHGRRLGVDLTNAGPAAFDDVCVGGNVGHGRRLGVDLTNAGPAAVTGVDLA